MLYSVIDETKTSMNWKKVAHLTWIGTGGSGEAVPRVFESSDERVHGCGQIEYNDSLYARNTKYPYLYGNIYNDFSSRTEYEKQSKPTPSQ